MNTHEVADIFPMMGEEDYRVLLADIRDNGLREPIWVKDGLILDGRNRYRACQELGMECRYREYAGEDLTDFVVSLNLARRHLTESQRAMVAGKLANLDNGQHSSANLHGTSARQAGDLLNVSERSVKTAKKVQQQGTEGLVDSVNSGAVSVSAAADIAELPEEVQTEVISEIEGGVKPRDAIYHHVSQKNNEWYTPAKYIDAARGVMGVIDCDPATSELAQETIMANEYFTKEDDGLLSPWSGKVWMNPPYSMPEVQQFVDKLLDSDGVDEWIVLTNNSSDTGWFHQLLAHCEYACFTKGRVAFENGEDVMATRQGQTFFYSGSNGPEFIHKFSEFGAMVELAA